MPGTIYKLKLDFDTTGSDKAARNIQSEFAKAFGGGGTSGLATDPSVVIRRLMGTPALATKGGLPYYTGPVPPVIGAGSQALRGVDWKQFFLGLGAAPFSPWVGARALSGSGAFGSGGGGGGLLGRLMGAGGLGGFMEAYIAIQVVMHGLRMAFEEMTSAVRRGAQLYLKAAELGTDTFTASRLQKTAQLLGMPESALTNLVASGQFMRGQRVTGQDMSNIMLGSGRGVLGKENLQALLNLSNEVAGAWNRVAEDAAHAARDSGALFKTNASFGELKSAWQGFWQDLATIASPFMDLMARGFAGLFRLASEQFEHGIEVMQFLHIIPKGMGELFGRKVAGPAVSRPESAWEKMGLIISGGIGGSDYARQTAMNTKRIADYLDNVKQSLPSLGDSTQQVSLA